MSMTIDIPKGESIHGAAHLAIAAARASNDHVEFDFNGIPLIATRHSCALDIATIYDLKCELRRLQS